MNPRRLCLLLVALGAAASLRAADDAPTVISSDSAEMVSTAAESTFTFRDHVVVTGTNIRITCDLLVVVANRTGDTKATIGKQDQFKSLVATGHVRILQNDREATCEKAEVIPAQDMVVLTGNPRVQSLDGKMVADGPVIELHRGERRAVILGGPQQRTNITLPPLKDLGYDKSPDKAAPAPKPATPPPPEPQK